MKKLKFPFIVSLITTLCILALLMYNQAIGVRALSDVFFLAALFFLIIGSALWIMASGFFDRFQAQMKKYLHLKKQQEQQTFIPFSEIGQAYYSFWIFTGAILLTVSIVFLLFYFLYAEIAIS